MKKGLCRLFAVFFSLLGTVLALYVGGWVLFIHPVHALFLAFSAGTLTRTMLIITIVKIIFAATAAGGIWCVCDIIAGIFRDRQDRD